MAEPKDTTSFFRKVVKFVANPATEWTDLDAPERRHARKRLRQGRAQGDDRAQAPQRLRSQARVRHAAQGAPRRPRRRAARRARRLVADRRLAPRARTTAGAPGCRRQGQDRRDRAADGRRQLRQHAAPRARVLQRADPAGAARMAGRSAARRAVRTAAGSRTSSPSGPPAGTAQTSRRGSRRRRSRRSTSRWRRPRDFGKAFSADNSEVTHDPDLDEAVIAFANADFEQCEQRSRR